MARWREAWQAASGALHAPAGPALRHQCTAPPIGSSRHWIVVTSLTPAINPPQQNIRVGFLVGQGSAPFTNVTNGQPGGFEVEMMKAVCSTAYLTCTFSPITSLEGRLEALVNKSVHVSIGRELLHSPVATLYISHSNALAMGSVTAATCSLTLSNFKIKFLVYLASLFPTCRANLHSRKGCFRGLCSPLLLVGRHLALLPNTVWAWHCVHARAHKPEHHCWNLLWQTLTSAWFMWETPGPGSDAKRVRYDLRYLGSPN